MSVDVATYHARAYEQFTNKATFQTNYVNELFGDMQTALGALTTATWNIFTPTAISKYTHLTDDLWSGLTATTILQWANMPDPPESDLEITDPPDDPQEPEYGDKPVKTEYTIPPDPTLHEFTIPDVPPLSLPTFTEVLGLDPSIVPAVSVESGALNFSSPLLDALLDKLEYDIENGGTGLSPTVETAIWQRGKERDDQDLADAIDKLEDTFARKAFMLPPSVMAEQITLLIRGWDDKQADRSREIMIKQAELEQENIKNRIQMTVEIEKQLTDIWERTQTRVLNWSVKVAEFAYETFKSQIAKYNAAIDAYKAKADVYKTIIEGETLKIEAYKAEIEALKAIAQLDEAIIKAYLGKIEAITAQIEMYKAEVQAYVAVIEGEKAKIELYGARVGAWGTKIKAILDIYQGQIEGAKAYIDGYTKIENINVQGLGEGIRAYAAWTGTQSAIAEAQIRAATQATEVHVEAHKAMATIYSSLFSAFCLSVQTHAQLTGTAQSAQARNENLSGSL